MNLLSLHITVPVFQYFKSPLFWWLFLLVPSVHSQTKCSYVGLAHFGLLCLSFVRICKAGSYGPWIGVDLIEMISTTSFSASRSREPRQLLVWGAFCVDYLSNIYCMLRPISIAAMQVQSCDYHFSCHCHATTRVKDKRLVSKCH